MTSYLDLIRNTKAAYIKPQNNRKRTQ